MDFSRRSFMNMLGIGGLGLGVGAASVLDTKPVALFGSDEETALVTPSLGDVAGHFVVYAKGFTERVPDVERAAYVAKGGYGIPVARITRNRDPGGTSLAFLTPRDGAITSRPCLPAGVNPHTAYYTASLDIQRRFAQFSRQTLDMVPAEMRPLASLVTVVYSPIHARPVGVQETVDQDWAAFDSAWFQDARKSNEDETGYDVACRFSQFVRVSGARQGVETFRQYSDQGEFPIQVPSTIDMALLMRMDKEVINAGEVAPDRISGLLSRFKV